MKDLSNRAIVRLVALPDCVIARWTAVMNGDRARRADVVSVRVSPLSGP